MNGWIIERVGERNIRITEPRATHSLVLDLGDTAPAMRVFWRLCCDLMDVYAIDTEDFKALSACVSAAGEDLRTAAETYQQAKDALVLLQPFVR